MVVAAAVISFSGSSSGQSDAPPEVFAFFDEQAEAEFNDAATTRANVKNVLAVGLAVVGITGLVIVMATRMQPATPEPS